MNNYKFRGKSAINGTWINSMKIVYIVVAFMFYPAFCLGEGLLDRIKKDDKMILFSKSFDVYVKKKVEERRTKKEKDAWNKVDNLNKTFKEMYAYLLDNAEYDTISAILERTKLMHAAEPVVFQWNNRQFSYYYKATDTQALYVLSLLDEKKTVNRDDIKMCDTIQRIFKGNAIVIEYASKVKARLKQRMLICSK
jgi:hypothetical protein